ncbi:class I SAM-dependent methyltransferase [Virgisporangium ochraceum]
MTTADFLGTTRSSYDTVAAEYAALLGDELDVKVLDRAVLTAFAELVAAEGGGRVADVGTGPGRISAYLAGRGVDVFGVDLSPGMVEVARDLHPHLRFEVGTMTALDLPDASLGGICAWYSIIHVPDGHLPAVFAEFRRVLKPGGHAVLAFQVGDETGERTEAFGHEIALTFHRRPPERARHLLAHAGLPVRATLVREPEVHPFLAEKVPQAFLFARKPAEPAEPAEPVAP